MPIVDPTGPLTKSDEPEGATLAQVAAPLDAGTTLPIDQASTPLDDGMGASSVDLLLRGLLRPDSAATVSRPTATSQMSPPLGGAGRYSKWQELATSKMSVVWKAHDEVLGRTVVVKQPLQATDAPAFRQRFRFEAQVTSRIAHPAIVPVYDLCDEGPDPPFYTMPFIDGQTFRQAAIAYREIRDPARRSMELRRLLTSFVTLARGVAYAHERGYIHRDLKGSNAMIGRFGEVVALDWGLAKSIEGPDHAAEILVGGGPGSSTDPTVPGQAMGTWQYMPPEQAVDAGLAEVRSDVFGLGAILFEVLTGSAPFSEARSLEGYQAAWESGGPRFTAATHAVPRPLRAIARKALAREPAGRYDTAQRLADDVDRWLNDQPVLADREPLLDRLVREARRHRAAVGAGFVLLLTTSLVLGVATVLLRRAYDQATVAGTQAEAEAKRATGLLLQSQAQSAQTIESLTAMLETSHAYAFRPGLMEPRLRLAIAGTALLETYLAPGAPQRFNPLLRKQAVDCYREQGLVCEFLDRLPEAERAYDRAVMIFDEWRAERKLITDPYMWQQAEALVALGRVRASVGQTGPAVETYGRLIELGERMSRDLLDKRAGRRALAAARLGRAKVFLVEGKPVNAWQGDAMLALTEREALAAMENADDYDRFLGIDTAIAIAVMLNEAGEHAAALPLAERAIDGARGFRAEAIPDDDRVFLLQRALAQAAEAGLAAGNPQMAAERAAEAMRLIESLVEESSEFPSRVHVLASSLLIHARGLVAEGRADEARALAERAVAELESVDAARSPRLDGPLLSAWAHQEWGLLEPEAERASELLGRAALLYDHAATVAPGHPIIRRGRAVLAAGRRF